MEAVAAYAHAWTRPDEAAIGVELERCWTSQSSHVSPITDKVIGEAGLTGLILDVPVMFPGAHFCITAPTDFHHDSARFAWRLDSTARIRMAGHDFGFSADGQDVLDFDPQNRIRRVITFFEAFGSHPDHRRIHPGRSGSDRRTPSALGEDLSRRTGRPRVPVRHDRRVT
jgi:hypothetical protein